MENELAQLPEDLEFGMYMRFPADEEHDTDFRTFRMGQLINWNPFAASAQIRILYEAVGIPAREIDCECPLEHLERCRILPDSAFQDVETGQQGRVLYACQDDFEHGEFAEYYVSMNGVVQRLPENRIRVGYARQAVSSIDQLRRYEFHNPVWRDGRNSLIESIYELQSATHGIEDLVGSRVLLLPHQAAVVTRVLSAPNCRFILADEVGLGKTVEAGVILKSLLRRNPLMRTLLIVPSALQAQWRGELREKFWLSLEGFDNRGDEPIGGQRLVGRLVTVEDLLDNPQLTDALIADHWDLLIIDEAHHVRKWPGLHQQLCQLSAQSERALILSATPIQRRAQEYLMLLRLMDPGRYLSFDEELFNQLVLTQDEIRRSTAYLSEILDPDLFAPSELHDELCTISDLLPSDPHIAAYARGMQTQSDTPSVREEAQAALVYIGTNYRIEQRVFRNRRIHINAELPTREFDDEYAYKPSELERIVFGSIIEYCTTMHGTSHDPLTQELCRILIHSAMSSPYALQWVLEQRLDALGLSGVGEPRSTNELVAPAAPRDEADRIRQVAVQAAGTDGEQTTLQRLIWETEQWAIATDQHLDSLSGSRQSLLRISQHRLHQVLLAIELARQDEDQPQLLLFSSWPHTIDVLVPYLRDLFGTAAVAQFRVGMTDDELYENATQFQADASCWILLSDELGGEGRNFQNATAIIHIDLPWTPALIEQRIGRVDRLGRSGVVRSVVPYALDSLEQDLFSIWQDGFELFSASMSGLEIALEGIQDELLAAMSSDFADGLKNLAPVMAERAAKIREAVEEERYFEEITIDREFEAAFESISEKYRDGKLLKRTVLGWGDLAGLHSDYEPRNDVVIFLPDRFNAASMQNARFIPPSMEESLAYMQRIHSRVLRGTFNRIFAIRQENLIFYAPGSDPWTDAVISNAVEADRGRCCAIQRRSDDLKEEWAGFELLFRIMVNPRPLFEAGLDPVHLLRAQGRFQIPMDRVAISVDGEIASRHSPIWKVLRKPFNKAHDIHLGRRSSPRPPIDVFRAAYPPDQWLEIVDNIVPKATYHMAEEYGFLHDLADDAADEFARQVIGWRASREWLIQQTGAAPKTDDIEAFERASRALVEGLRSPIINLESVCFWDLRPK